MNSTENGNIVSKILEAHGSRSAWQQKSGLSSVIQTGGVLWAMKGMPLPGLPVSVTSEFHKQSVTMSPFGEPNWSMDWTPELVEVKDENGQSVLSRNHPRDAFSGHNLESQWDPLHLAYFNGYAMWTYHALPFVIGDPGYRVIEIEPPRDGEQFSHGIEVEFPAHIHSHCRRQQLFFGEDGLLMRHDYEVDVFGGTFASHFLSDYVDSAGILLATKRRVHPRRPDGTIERNIDLVTIHLSEFKFH